MGLLWFAKGSADRPLFEDVRLVRRDAHISSRHSDRPARHRPQKPGNRRMVDVSTAG